MNREQLISMPISQLRSLDIKSAEEEQLVQEILNEKLQNEPQVDPNRASLSSRETDNLTPEKEAELQARLDGKVVSQETETVDIPVEIVDISKPFCEFCDAKGPISHKANCTRKQVEANKITE